MVLPWLLAMPQLLLLLPVLHKALLQLLSLLLLLQ
jgi:hypothetical protein